MSRRWLSVDKELPGWCEQVIVAHRAYDWSNKTHRYHLKKKLNVQAATHWQDGRFTCSGVVLQEVVAWQPLPEPPKTK